MLKTNDLTRAGGALALILAGLIAAPAQAANQAAGGEAAGISLSLLAAVAGCAGLAAALCSSLVVYALGRRRDVPPPQATLEGVEAAHARLAAVANRAARAQESSAEAAESAMMAAQDAAKTVARFVEVTTETHDRLRDWLAHADKGQEKAATLANQCGKLTEILPDLLAGAVESMQARGLAGIEEAAGQVRQSADVMEAAAAAWRQNAADAAAADSERIEAIAAAQERQAELTQACSRIVDGLPDIISATMANAYEVLEKVADRLMAETTGLEAASASVREGAAGLTLAAVGQAECQASAENLAAQCERLARDLPATLTAAVRATADLDRANSELAADRLRESSEFMQAASAALRESVAGLVRAEAVHSELGRQAAALTEQSALMCEELPLRADAAIGAIEKQARSAVELVEARWQDSTLGIEAAAASLHDGVRAIAQATQMPAERLEAAVARAEQVGHLIPEISSQLSAQATELRQQSMHDMQVIERAAAALEQAAKHSREAAAQAAQDAGRVLADMGSSQETALALAARVETTLAALPRETAAISDVAANLQTQAAGLASAVGQIETAAQAAMAGAVACSQILPEIETRFAHGTSTLCEAAERGAQTLACVAATSEQTMAVCGGSLAAAARQMREVMDDMVANQRTTDALAARADAALGVLPLEAGQIAAAAASLREDAVGLCTAARQIEGAAAEHTHALAARLERPVATLDALSAQVAATLACGADRLAETGAALRAQMAAGGESVARQVSEAAMELVAAARQVPRIADDPVWRESVASLAALLDRIGALSAGIEEATHRLALAAETAPAPQIDVRLANLEVTVEQLEGARDVSQTMERTAWRESAASFTALLDRLGALSSGVETSANRLALVAETMAAPRIDPPLAHLEAAIANVSAMASRLALCAEAQDRAATRVNEAAVAVAAAAAPVASAGLSPEIPTLARLATLASEAQALQAAAGELARTAVHGDPPSLPPGIGGQVPAILAAIETSIQGLRGTATALAIASDAARIAA